MPMVIGTAAACWIGRHMILPRKDVRLLKTVATIPDRLKKENNFATGYTALALKKDKCVNEIIFCKTSQKLISSLLKGHH